MNSVFTYYLGWILLSYLLRQPWLLLGLLVLLLFSRFLPSPNALVGLLGRARRLRAQVEINRANITARRDLAVIYLEGRRARSAIPLLEEGLALSPNDAELLYLLGLALDRAGRHEESLPRLVRAIEIDARVRYGLPYVAAGDALAALGRWEEALDAYERYLGTNTSDVSAYTRLARARARTGDAKGARDTLTEGIRTWGVLPSSMKRRQFGRYIRAHLARVSVLREPKAIAQLCAAIALCALLLSFVYAPVVNLFTSKSRARLSVAERHALYEAFARCGSQSTGAFSGRYAVRPESLRAAAALHANAARRGPSNELVRRFEERYSNFEVRADRIVSGGSVVQAFCLSRVRESSPTTLLSEAVWLEDVQAPGDASMVILRLKRQGDVTVLQLKPLGDASNESVLQLTLEPRG